MTGDDFKKGMNGIGYGIAWAGFWLMVGLVNFQGCTNGSNQVETVRSIVR